jgi:hypothetical protein
MTAGETRLAQVDEDAGARYAEPTMSDPMPIAYALGSASTTVALDYALLVAGSPRLLPVCWA